MNLSPVQEQTDPVVEEEISLDFVDGYVICSKCNGEGRIKHKGSRWSDICPKCWGKKKLDWIENVVGVEEPQWGSGSSSSSSSSHQYGKSVTPSTALPTSRSVKEYIDMKGKMNVNNNQSRSRTVQRFYKMFNKSKRCM